MAWINAASSDRAGARMINFMTYQIFSGRLVQVGGFSAGLELGLLLERRGWVWGAQMVCGGGFGLPPTPTAVLVLITRNISALCIIVCTVCKCPTKFTCRVYNTVHDLI